MGSTAEKVAIPLAGMALGGGLGYMAADALDIGAGAGILGGSLLGGVAGGIGAQAIPNQPPPGPQSLSQADAAFQPYYPTAQGQGYSQADLSNMSLSQLQALQAGGSVYMNPQTGMLYQTPQGFSVNAADPYQTQVENQAWQIAQQQGGQALQSAVLRANQVQQNNATRAQLLAQLPGVESTVGSDLLNAENAAFAHEQPLINEQLNALGIQQSGALAGAQQQYLSNLEAQRQQELAAFDTQNQQLLNVQFPLNVAQQNIAGQQAAYENQLAASQANLQNTFQLQDIAGQNANQYGAMQQAMNLAREQMGYGMFGSLVGAGGSILGGYLSNPRLYGYDRSSPPSSYYGGYNNLMGGVTQSGGYFGGGY